MHGAGRKWGEVMELLLALDMGTTHIKAAAFTLEGAVRAQELIRNEAATVGPGSAVYDPQELWARAAELLRRTTSRLDKNDKIAALSVASMGEAGLFIDEKGNPLTPIMAWFDIRGKEVMEEWYNLVPPERCFQATGLNYNYIYSAYKILWHKKHDREAFDRGAKWLCVPDYIYYRLTGEYATDYSIASRTMLFDIHQRQWSEELLALAGLRQKSLPTPCQSGTVIGQVTARAAAETGLEVGIPVVAGGHDHICGAFAAGVIEPGKVLDSMGTSESLVAAFSMEGNVDISRMQGFNVGCHLVPGCHYIHGGVDSGGISFEWFRETFEEGKDYGVLVEQARSAPLGAQGMFFIPHLRGGSPPVRDPYSKAGFVGVRDFHTKADFIRHEGLACEVAQILRTMETVLGVEFSEVYAIGGGTKNPLWMEIKSHVFGRPINVPEITEATLLGAALLAGVGAGIYKSYREAVVSASRMANRYLPGPDLQKKYQEVCSKYVQIAPLMREISRIVGEF